MKSFQLIKGGYEFCACCLPFRADFYQGCPHNCAYCYARNIGNFRKFWPSSPKPITTPQEIRKVFHRAFRERKKGYLYEMMRHKLPFRCGVMTENFPPIEKQHRLTYEFLRCLVEFEYPAVFNTKSDLVAEKEYVELLKKLAQHEKVVVQMTLISLDESLLRRLEPGAPSPEKRLNALKTLSDNGIPTQIRLSPYIPSVTEDYPELIRRAKEVGVKTIITEFLRIPGKPLREEINKAVNKDLWEYYKKEGAKWISSYLRYPVEKKFQFYRKLKKIVEEMGMYLFVCSEEDPSINDKPVSCANCCGTDFYEGFRNYNTATFNNLYKLLMERGEVTLEDMQRNFYSPRWDLFQEAWECGYFEKILINTKKVEKEGRVVYQLINTHRSVFKNSNDLSSQQS